VEIEPVVGWFVPYNLLNSSIDMDLPEAVIGFTDVVVVGTLVV